MIGESFLKPDGARTDARDSLNGIPSRFLIEFILRPILICEVSRWLRDLASSLSQTSRRAHDILGRRTVNCQRDVCPNLQYDPCVPCYGSEL